MSFERWNAFLQEQLGMKQGQTPPQPAQENNESEVLQRVAQLARERILNDNVYSNIIYQVKVRCRRFKSYLSDYGTHTANNL